MTWIAKRRDSCPQRNEVCDFQVIGELKADPSYLLLLGDDGQCYAMDPGSGEVLRLDPDDSWAMDLIENASLRLEAPRHVIA